ncbi:bifunctional glutamate N-acetyltransferase/amino-acid acetyltransferase ArgJ [Kaustia mangrovi]|uniref:Arginine biosynthesis bifunctional protein ArgJ n=1 Tax=Kaustia mangrovi TaxID=2593653 RepID=A0A7S8C449_9HYPH|nr:bifunctional glutamate N-acetyltransferase/amino-acid acetyltransferase ArgJ [Kaustia mangrovi]QPC43055.1 bifunctional glutamate N-acetyltransferase/amino-acid acetyltransferase ArgJ [Kaustia mangrovi]
MTERSPLAPAALPELPAMDGVRLAAIEAGIRYSGRTDLMLALVDDGAVAAGVFTRSRTASAPVEWCRKALGSGTAPRAILVNSGNANAFTGRRGAESTAQSAEAVARRAGCPGEAVYLASTGVIGEPLPSEPIVTALDGLFAATRPDGWQEAAEAIMTTDTFPKLATATAELGGRTVTLNGIAKGSGMIAPDMATMLAFLFTDAALPQPLLQEMLADSVDRSFNCITVDGDTSTSDTVLLFATGKAGNSAPGAAGADAPELADFRRALDEVTRALALLVVRDGEGAEKFVTVTVSGAESDAAARRIGLAIGNSPLVKTAIAGEDANWGRIVMAVGKAGEAADRDALSIAIGGVRVARDGERDPDYREEDVAPHMKGREIDIAVDVGVGNGTATIWTCDLTHRYIDINADYRS